MSTFPAAFTSLVIRAVPGPYNLSFQGQCEKVNRVLPNIQVSAVQLRGLVLCSATEGGARMDGYYL